MITGQKIDFEYCFGAWERHLKDDPKSVVLSDSFGNHVKRNELDRISGKVYAYLKENNIGKSDYVLINLDRGIKPVLAIMGVLKAGAAFTIVETGYAQSRIDFIRSDSNAVFEINEKNWPDILSMAPLSGYEETDDHDPCLSVYTSGTTGTPKGVCHEYGQMKLEMLSEQNPDGTWRENRDTRWGLVAPLNFVASLKIVVHFIYCGGHLYVLDYDTVKNPRKLNAYFFTNKINETFLSPSLIRLKGSDYGPYMRNIYTGAEPANRITVNKAALINTYTMSESFFTVSEFIIDRAYDSAPIGNPRFDLPIKLIKENGEIAEEGEVGEFCYYNPYCRGYINNPTENERHFIDGWFHTGDLAVYQDGQYILKGRSDDMIKIDGNRIEPSEIESACCSTFGLKNCVAKGFEQEGQVALYYTEDREFDSEDAAEKLSSVLPYYMIPSHFIRIEKLPITSSGKIERKSLRLPLIIKRAEYVEPRNEFERRLTERLEKLFNIEKIGIKDDFFDLGGTSIMVMELLSRLDDDDVLTPSMVFQGRTVEKISELYRSTKLTHMSIEEKEEEGRCHQYPLNDTMKWVWLPEYDASLDFFSGIKLNALIPSGMIVNGINRYIDLNSTFNMVIHEDENGTPMITYCPDKPYIQVEKMSEAQFCEFKDSFVRPFACDEPLIRIKYIRTPLHSYLLFHASHMVLDGAAMHLLIEDMTNCIQNNPVEPVHYFAWAFEENLRLNSPNIPANRQYFVEKYFEKEAAVRIKPDEAASGSGYAKTHNARIPLKSVKDYCKKENISVNMFLVASTLLTMSAYNDSEQNMIYWNYDNRGPKDDHAGLMIRVLFAAMDRGEIKDLPELYESLNRQNSEMFWRCYERDYYSEYKHGTSVMTVTYLEDWFSEGMMPKFIGSTFDLVNSCPISDQSDKSCVLLCFHEKDQLCASLQYGLSYNTPESAARFISMLEYFMKEIVAKNAIPDVRDFAQ